MSSLDDAIKVAVTAAIREALPALLADLGKPKLLKIKECGISYRAILDAERSGQLKIYRIGHASLVDEAELYTWIRLAAVQRQPEQPTDEVAELIMLNDRRRRAPRKVSK